MAGPTDAIKDKIFGKGTAEKDYVGLMANVYGISPETLWGVYGTESAYGTNLGPSSAGAQGHFQFMPATAKQYKVDVTSFHSGARGAADYLNDLGADRDPKSSKTVNALNRYNGNGGGTTVTDYVKKVWQEGETYGKTGPVDATSGAIEDATNVITAPMDAAQDVGAAIAGGVQWLTDPSSWLRVGKGVAGLTFIIIGVGGLVYIATKPAAKAMAGVVSPVKKVKSVANAASSAVTK